MFLLRIITAFLLLAGSALAQIEVADATVDHKPLTARLILGVEESSEATVTWTADTGTSFVPSSEKFGLALWAAPGEHWLKATATVVVFETLEVFVPDQQDPKNPAKAKLKTVKIFVSSRVQEFPVKTFRIVEATTPVTPNPKPDDVTPKPTPYPDSPLGLVRVAASNVPTGRFIESGVVAAAHQRAVTEAQRNRFTLVATMQARVTEELQKHIPAEQLVAWKSWEAAVASHIKLLESSGKMASRDDWIAAFQEIVQGCNLRTNQ